MSRWQAACSCAIFRVVARSFALSSLRRCHLTDLHLDSTQRVLQATLVVLLGCQCHATVSGAIAPHASAPRRPLHEEPELPFAAVQWRSKCTLPLPLPSDTEWREACTRRIC